jgi:hypothetical protein
MMAEHTLTAEVAAEYARLTAAGAPAGAETMDRARRALDPVAVDSERRPVADIQALLRAGLMTKAEARRAAGLPAEAAVEATGLLRAAGTLALYIKYGRLGDQYAERLAHELAREIDKGWPGMLAQVEAITPPTTLTQSEESK